MWVLFKGKIDILSFKGFSGFSINIKLCFLFFIRDCLLNKKTMEVTK